MALSVRESNDVNVLIDWLLGDREDLRRNGEVTFDDAREALARMADAAYKTVSAGTDGRGVRERWKARNGTGALRRRRAKPAGRASAGN